MNMKSGVSALSAKINYSDVVFWITALLLFFWALGYRGLYGSEGRWAEITREMFLTGDFFHPTINGEPYYDKPLLTYWLIALISHVVGRLDEWIVRLPSALSGLLGLWATVYLGRRLWSKKVGITAGWILLTTYGVLCLARTGSADMENLAATTLAVAWYWARRERPNFFTCLVFYLICFLGAHTKGLTAVVVPIIVVLPDLVRERRWRVLLSPSHLLALTVGCAVYFAPFIYSAMTNGEYQESGLALVFQENILRYFQPFDHKEPFYCYFYYLPMLFLPWTPLFLAALWGTFTNFKRLNPSSRWLAEAVIVIFIFFMCSGSRRSYYILPILPFCALLTSVFFNSERENGRIRFVLGFQGGLFVIVSLIEILSLAVWPVLKERMGFVPPGDLKLATPILGILALFPWVLSYVRPALQADFMGTNQKIAPMVAAAIILMGGFFCWQQVSLDVYRRERPFAMELKALVTGLSPEQIAFYCTLKTNTLFYLDLPRPVRFLRDTDSVRNFLESCRGDKVLITKRKCLKDLSPALPARFRDRPTLSSKVYPWQRKSIGKLLAWKIKGREK